MGPNLNGRVNGAGQLPPPSRKCPPWCDRSHDVDDQDAFYHTRVVAECSHARVCLSQMQYRDRRRGPDGPVILVKTGGQEQPRHLLPDQAAEMLDLMQGAGSGSTCLADALREALTLLRV